MATETERETQALVATQDGCAPSIGYATFSAAKKP